MRRALPRARHRDRRRDRATIDCVGTRCVIDGVDAGSLGSARLVSGWFGQDEAFILLALRAAEAVGHESDLVAATLFDPEGWVPVEDPRLSTTYAESGLPARTNLELWIGEGENEFPRRVAGEAAGDGAVLQHRGGRSCRSSRCGVTAVGAREPACTCSPPSSRRMRVASAQD